MINMLDQILPLAKIGLRIHPLSSKNKIPLLDDWTNKATTDEKIIRSWAKKYKDCNWGIATGISSNVFVVDIDPKHNGRRAWIALLKEFNGGKNPKTVEVVTGTEGTHLYFLYPGNIAVSNSSIGKGIDIRGEGGNIVLPPSIHPNGNTYEWADGRSPDKIKIAKAPAWLLKIVKKVSAEEFTTQIGEKIPRGERNNTIYHQALMLARQGALFDFALATMKSWVRSTKNFDMSEKEIEATVESAYKFQSDEEQKKTETESIERSDVGNVKKLLQGHGQNLRYAVGLGYHVWDTRRWQHDEESLAVKQMAIRSMDDLRDETLDQLKTTTDKAGSSALLGIYNWAINSHNASRLSSIVDLAKTYSSVLKLNEDFDNEQTDFLLNFKNGTLDLRTGELSPPDKEQYITRLITHAYNPKAKCPNWLKTLDLAFNGNKELITYFQRAIGYSISGSMSEQCFFICWGESGNNGKSTMLEAIQNILGKDYALMSDASVISSREKNNHVLGSLALLNKVRMVSINEFGEMAVLDEELIKQLTGGDTVQAKRLYLSPFTFKPIFKIWVRANAKPVVYGTGNAFWRRVKLIPFEHSIPVEYRKPRHEVDAMLLAEAEGILAWAVEGFQDWFNNGGLRDPQPVAKASADYRHESDVINLFWDECVEETKPTEELARSTLYMVFKEWADQQGMRRIMTADKFSRKVSVRLSQPERIRNKSGIAIWRGITMSKYAISTFNSGF